jgi:hypothetical protein
LTYDLHQTQVCFIFVEHSKLKAKAVVDKLALVLRFKAASKSLTLNRFLLADSHLQRYMMPLLGPSLTPWRIKL